MNSYADPEPAKAGFFIVYHFCKRKDLRFNGGLVHH